MIFLPFQAVVFDLDDTLLRDDLSISDFTLSVLRRVSSLGVSVIAASGRSQFSMKPFVDRLDCISLYVSCNGAEIWDAQSHQLLHAECFSPDLGREIAAFGNQHHCYMQTYADTRFFYNEESVWAERYAAASVLDGVFVGDLELFILKPLNKILMMAEEAKIASMLDEARIRFYNRASVTCSKPWFLEFNPVNATKGIALTWIAEMLNLDLSCFIAFGNGLNDLPMLQVAGRGVLMDNGLPSLRLLVDDICLSNQEDGVARYLSDVFREVLS